MNKKILFGLSLVVGQVMAMEILDVQASEEAEKKVLLKIEDQTIELPRKYIPLIDMLKNLKEDVPESEEVIQLPEIRLATWQFILPQLERLGVLGKIQAKPEIINQYSQLTNDQFVELALAIEYLNIPRLKKILAELLEKNLTYNEILRLPEDLRNEFIKERFFSRAEPYPAREIEEVFVLTRGEIAFFKRSEVAGVTTKGLGTLPLCADTNISRHDAAYIICNKASELLVAFGYKSGKSGWSCRIVPLLPDGNMVTDFFPSGKMCIWESRAISCSYWRVMKTRLLQWR